MSEELKITPNPCPMCNAKKYRHFKQLSNTEWGYECGKCGLSTGKYPSKEDAISAWNKLSHKLQWAKKKPTEEGWYWWRESKKHLPQPRKVYYVGFTKEWCVTSSYLNCEYLRDVEGEWAGPIPGP